MNLFAVGPQPRPSIGASASVACAGSVMRNCALAGAWIAFDQVDARAAAPAQDLVESCNAARREVLVGLEVVG